DIRRVPLALPIKGQTQGLDSFASAIMRSFDERSIQEAQQGEQDALPYGTFIRPEEFPHYSSDQILQSDDQMLKRDVGFKIVIIGGAWHQYGFQRGPENDAHESPVGSVYGSFIHANYVEA